MTTTTPTTAAEALAALNFPRPITGSTCENCGTELAWRSGIGRVVITHATGEDRCYPASPVARLSEADVDKANAELQVMDDLLVQHKRLLTA